MTGKKLCKNLKYYLDPLVTENVYLFDHHNTRELPCVYVGYDAEDGSFSNPIGHYTVSGFVTVLYQGYEDLNNESADITSEIIIDALGDRTPLKAAVNYPLSGTDSRPASAFHLNDLFIRGVTREDDDHSTGITIRFDAFCAAKDR